MNERLSWKEIQNKYPDMWVGLTDVIYEDDNDKANIVSAIVKYCDKSRDELYLITIETKGEVDTRYTTPSHFAGISFVTG